MNRGFYSLPAPQEAAGLAWPAYERAREQIAAVEERSRQATTKARTLEQRIREEERADVRKLAQSILAGNADPAAPVEELEGLGAELREQRRLREALDQALPEAEERLRRTAHEHQAEWTSQADEALEEAIEEEREAYQRAQEIAQKARERRLYLEALADWTRRVPQTFNVPADVAIPSTVQGWEEDASRCERQMQERHQNEQLEREATGEGAV
jgi:hypothetical protein